MSAPPNSDDDLAILASNVEEQAEVWELVQDAIAIAKREWSDIVLSPSEFLAFLRPRILETDDSSAAALQSLCLSDLFLCAACCAQDETALRYFSGILQRETEIALRRMDTSGDLTSEVHQQLYGELFVAEPPKQPKIAKYRGNGPLGRWLHVVATRQGLMWLRSTRKEIGAAPARDMVGRDFELDYLKQEYRSDFSLAFEEAMSQLDAKARNLLYYHTVQGLSLEQMSAIYRVHRTTVFRWLRDARHEILQYTRENLASRLLLDDSQVDSILALIRSRMDVSVERLLAADRVGMATKAP